VGLRNEVERQHKLKRTIEKVQSLLLRGGVRGGILEMTMREILEVQGDLQGVMRRMRWMEGRVEEPRVLAHRNIRESREELIGVTTKMLP